MVRTAAVALAAASALAAAQAQEAGMSWARGMPGAARATCARDYAAEARENREKVRGMFSHAYSSYLEHAWPWDELRPLTCDGRRWDRRERGTIDDTLGGFALTLVDSLDALAVLGMHDEFFDAVERVKDSVHFDRDVTVSLFETNIRVLGGLLSAHLLIADGRLPTEGRPAYGGELLALARDLGTRMLPAFDTPTGIPFHRVNLRHGVEASETKETCTAAAGTLLMEMGLLSRLTGEPAFERAARRAMNALWQRRDPGTGLLGNTIRVDTGRWQSQFASTGAGVDSFFEYLFKAHYLLDDPHSPYYENAPAEDLLDRFVEAILQADEHMGFGPWHVDVNRQHGQRFTRNWVVSALQAFWPGMLASAGKVEEARDGLQAYFTVWRHFGALPESFDVSSRSVPHNGRHYFLRPELAESAMVLYEKTGDPSYLAVGEKIMRDIESRCRVKCGYAALRDVTATDAGLDNRMDSFFLAETLKYLYMLFDMGARRSRRPSTLVPPGGKHVFSTEGHIFVLPRASQIDSGVLARRRRPADSAPRNSTNPSPPPPPLPKRTLGKPVHATVGIEAMLSPHLHVPVHKPRTAEKAGTQVFKLASARFGAPLLKDPSSNEERRFLVVRADPVRACGELRNAGAIERTVRAAQDLRVYQGVRPEVAVFVERGGCAFAEKAARVANQTSAPLVLVWNSAERDDRVHTMASSADEPAAGARRSVTTLMAPYSLGKLLHEQSTMHLGLFDTVHISHQTTLRLAWQASAARAGIAGSGQRAGRAAGGSPAWYDLLVQVLSQL